MSTPNRFDQDPEYTKLASCGYGYPHPNHFVFGYVGRRIGHYRGYYVVFDDGTKPDDSKTRFFFLHSGAKGYFDHLIGLGEPRPEANKGALWGWESVEEMEAFLNQRAV